MFNGAGRIRFESHSNKCPNVLVNVDIVLRRLHQPHSTFLDSAHLCLRCFRWISVWKQIRTHKKGYAWVLKGKQSKDSCGTAPGLYRKLVSVIQCSSQGRRHWNKRKLRETIEAKAAQSLMICTWCRSAGGTRKLRGRKRILPQRRRFLLLSFFSFLL